MTIRRYHMYLKLLNFFLTFDRITVNKFGGKKAKCYELVII